MSDWIYITERRPPISENKVGKGSMTWYEVLYDDGTVGQACWWHDHWYCCIQWGDIVAWKTTVLGYLSTDKEA